QLDNKISSAREIGGRSDSNYGNRRRGAIELFEYPGFFGRSKKYERDISNLQPEGFNDRTRAIVITEGTWELCADANFRNYCQSFGPGRYADIDSELSGKVSSLRLIAGYDNAPYSHSGGRDYSPQRSGGRIIFYNEEGFTGRNFDLSEEAANFANARFNDETVSVLVESGTWEVCTDSFFRGQCRTLSPGTVRRLEAPFYRSISSARLVQDNANAGRDDDRRRGIEIFEHSDFNGRKFSARRSVNDLSEEDFNDIASSIIIYSGQWEVCVDAYFRGRCVVYGPGRYANLYGLNDQISSLRRLDRP
ncbi:MAG: beta/gamma crystallin family protein, partial [Betaproteobacteria bacterium]|nr:beta/gamma crystallin family protein [Betaproteobacteria bacterium]